MLGLEPARAVALDADEQSRGDRAALGDFEAIGAASAAAKRAFVLAAIDNAAHRQHGLAGPLPGPLPGPLRRVIGRRLARLAQTAQNACYAGLCG
jgi:hypothetical protein